MLKETINITPIVEQFINWENLQLIEHYFCNSENDIKKLFEEIEEDPDQIVLEQNIARVAIFLHDMAYRNPSYRNEIAGINNATLNAIRKMNLSTAQRKYGEEHFGAEQARKQQLHAITNTESVLKTYKRLFEEYHLFFATAESGACFLISDDPAAGIRYNMPEICFPISPKHALLFRKPNIVSPLSGTEIPTNSRINLSIGSVIRHNLFQFCFASRYVFGDIHNLNQMKLLWESSMR